MNVKNGVKENIALNLAEKLLFALGYECGGHEEKAAAKPGDAA